MALCGVVAGCDSWVEMAMFCKNRLDWFRKFLELPNGILSHDTFGRVFSLIDPNAFTQCFASWIRVTFALKEGAEEVIALDGKTLRRSHDRAKGIGAAHLVSVWMVHRRVILGQIKTESKSNEMKAMQEILPALSLKGTVVTIDAAGCQKKIVEQILNQGGHDVLSLKGNQGTLHKEVHLYFVSAQKDNFKGIPHATHTTVDGDHGRIETRQTIVTDDVEWFEDKARWKGLKTFAMVTATREIRGKISRETRSFISSLPMDARKIAEIVRADWGIENGLHWSLDIAFREDESRVRKGHGPANLGLLRRIAASLIKQDTAREAGVSACRKKASWNEDYLLQLLRFL